MNTKVVSDNIRAERNRRNLTIEEVAKVLDISKATYVEYEKDATNCKAITFMKMAELYNCDVDIFFKNQN